MKFITIFVFVLVVNFVFNYSNQLSAKSPADSTSTAVKVMTFNVQMTDEYANLNKKQMVADLIKSHKVDIVGFQEYHAPQLKDLAKLLPDYSWIAADTYDGDTTGKYEGRGEFTTILYLKEK